MARVLLVQPHRNIRDEKKVEEAVMPTTLIWLASNIMPEHNAKIFDRNVGENYKDERFIDCLKEFNPDIIGFTSMTSPSLFDLKNLCDLTKSINKNIITIVGGVHVTLKPESVLKEKNVDFILKGEGEEAFLEFCDKFDKKEELKSIKNINMNPVREFSNLDKLKLPDYDLVNIKDYFQFFISTSRGCPGDCTFCYNVGMWGKGGKPCVRFLNVEGTKKVLRDAIDRGITDFTIADDNFLTFKSRCVEICRFLKEKYPGKINFMVFARADFIDEAILKELKEAGCHTVQLGSESGSQRVLDFLNKNISVEKQGEAIETVKKAGIFCDSSFMAGIPTETMEELEMTREFIKKYQPDTSNIKIFNPLPGSKIFDDLVEQGKIKEPETVEQWGEWVVNWDAIVHNFSNIPDKELKKLAEDMYSYQYYKKMFKKFIYWLKKGKIKYLLIKLKYSIFKKDYKEAH